MYRLEFTPDEQGMQRFELCHQAVLLTDRTITEDDELDVVELLCRFDDVSVPALETVGVIRLRNLQPAGGIIQLERSAYRFLRDCFKRPIWRPHVIVAKRAVQDWLASLENI